MAKILFLRSGENYDRDQASLEAGLKCDPEESVVQQQFRDECDINVIVERFGLTGELPQNLRMPQSGDFTGLGTFQDAMSAVRLAEEAFMALPASTRARFHNDPQELIDFCEDYTNRPEAIKLGLVPPPPPPDPVPPGPPSVKTET